MQSPCQKLGYTEGQAFTLLTDEDGRLSAGDIVYLHFDDKTDCPEFRDTEEYDEDDTCTEYFELHKVAPVIEGKTPAQALGYKEGDLFIVREDCEFEEGEIVELPEFGEGKPFIAKLRRPSLMALAKNGKIPNGLLETANSLFFSGVKESTLDMDSLSNMFELMEVVASACFIEPSWEEIQESGVQLTDEQLMAVYQYSQKGINALKPFRKVRADTPNN